MKQIIKTLLIALSFMALPMQGAAAKSSYSDVESPVMLSSLSAAFKPRLKAAFSPRTPLSITIGHLDEARQKRKIKKYKEYPDDIENLLAGGPREIEFVFKDVTNYCSMLKKLAKPYCFQFHACFNSHVYEFIIEQNTHTQEVKDLRAYHDMRTRAVAREYQKKGKVISPKKVDEIVSLEFIPDERLNEFIYNQVFVMRAELKLLKLIQNVRPSTIDETLVKHLLLLSHLEKDLDSKKRIYIDEKYSKAESILTCALENTQTLDELKILTANDVFEHYESKIPGYKQMVRAKERVLN